MRSGHRSPHRSPRSATRGRAPCAALSALGALAASAALSPLALSAQEAPPPWAATLDSLVEAELARTGTPGAQVAVVLDGRVAYTRGYGVADAESGRPVSAQTLFRVGSVTKMFAGATLADLAADGKLDLHAPIARYVPELEGRRVGTVTAHQLLTHTAGWHDEARAYGRMGEGALGEVMREVTDTLFFTEPGATLSYSNPGFSMAGYVAERAGGSRFGSLAEERVLRPVGMTRATFRPLVALTYDASQGHVGAPGAPAALVRPYTENTAQWAAGFLFASAGEIGRFAVALMDGGRIDGRQALDSAAVALLTTGYVPMPGSPLRYGYGIGVGALPTTAGDEPVWRHNGAITGFDASVTMWPARRAAVVRLDNRAGVPLRGIDSLVAVIAGVAPPAPAPRQAARAATAAERAMLAGTYRQGRTRFLLLADGDSLVFRQGMRTYPVRLEGDDLLRILDPDDPDATLGYRREADGTVRYLYYGVRALAKETETQTEGRR